MKTKRTTKIYQVVEKEFYISNGTDYLSAVSPFNKGLAYRKKGIAFSVARNLFNEYKETYGNGFVQETENSFTAWVNKGTMRCVITIEIIDLW